MGSALALATWAGTAAAHVRADGARVPHDAHELIRMWSFEPSTALPLALVLVLYATGLARLRRTRHRMRRQAACFGAGWLVLAVALVSPLHPWGSALFTAHMVQHELLMLAAAPLLVLASPWPVLLRGLPVGTARALTGWTRAGVARSAWRGLTRPFTAWSLHLVTLWAWHAPALFGLALRSEGAHALQHASFLGGALLFWWAVLRDRAHAGGAAVLALFTTAIHAGLLGALLTLSGAPWYPAYANTAPWWGLTPLEDQQLGGLVMWAPACLVYVGAGLMMFARWLEASGRTAWRPAGATAPPSAGAAAPVTRIGLLLLALLCAAAWSAGCIGAREHRAGQITGGDAERGRADLIDYGCGACHEIPGVRGAHGRVGPPLTGIASRAYIAGVLPNTSDNMVRWILDPPAVDSLTVMPNMRVTPRDARDITSYLYTLQ